LRLRRRRRLRTGVASNRDGHDQIARRRGSELGKKIVRNAIVSGVLVSGGE
jgi:hypothetical protein